MACFQVFGFFPLPKFCYIYLVSSIVSIVSVSGGSLFIIWGWIVFSPGVVFFCWFMVVFSSLSVNSSLYGSSCSFSVFPCSPFFILIS